MASHGARKPRWTSRRIRGGRIWTLRAGLAVYYKAIIADGAYFWWEGVTVDYGDSLWSCDFHPVYGPRVEPVDR